MPIASSVVATVGGAVGLLSLLRPGKANDDVASSNTPDLEQPRGVKQALRFGSELINLWRRELLNLQTVHTYLQVRSLSKRDISREIAHEVCQRGKRADPCEWASELERILRLLFLSRSMAQTAHVPATRRLENFCRSAGVSEDKVLAYKMKAGVVSPAFVLFRDAQHSSLVLVIRGTAEKWDMLTNLTGITQPHHIFPQVASSLGSPELGFAHRGLVKSAYRLCKEHLLKHQDPKLLDAVRDERNRGFDLLICGHSLGAGTAAFLTAMLREQSPELSHAKCVAFACPPCATKGLSEACRSFVTTVVNSADVVPTMSYKSISDYKYKLADDNASRRCGSTTGRLSGAFNACTGGLRSVSSAGARFGQSIRLRKRCHSAFYGSTSHTTETTSSSFFNRVGSTPTRILSGPFR